MTKTKFTPEQKIQIVLESIKTNISTAELCRKHNVHPTTFQTWSQQFLDAGKARLAHHGNADSTKASKREIDNLKRIIGELTIANDVLKKPWRKAEVERGQADATADEPCQVAKVHRRIKMCLALQAQDARGPT